MQSLPEADIESHFHSRLLSMEKVGQDDEDGSIFSRFGRAVVSGEEQGESLRCLGVPRPQANRH